MILGSRRLHYLSSILSVIKSIQCKLNISANNMDKNKNTYERVFHSRGAISCIVEEPSLETT
jgi:hypothetical protein